MRMRKKISIVTSAYNEAECIDELARRLSAMFDQMPAYDFEAIVVENGSEDDSGSAAAGRLSLFPMDRIKLTHSRTASCEAQT